MVRNSYRKIIKGPVYSGSSALEFDHSFDPFNHHYFDQFQKNLKELQNRVSLLSFMVGELQEALEISKSSVNSVR